MSFLTNGSWGSVCEGEAVNSSSVNASCIHIPFVDKGQFYMYQSKIKSVFVEKGRKEKESEGDGFQFCFFLTV